MKTSLSGALALCFALLSGCGSLQAAAPTGKSAELVGAPYTWYEGDQPRQAWIDPALIAEFPDHTASGVQEVAPSARELPSPERGIRLWALEQGAGGALRSLQSAQPEGRYSPVLRDPGGRMRALPGNVLVYLDPALDSRQAQDWLSGQGLEVLRRLDFAPNAWLVRSEPGLAALELANRLRQAPTVEAATPEWWQETVTR